MAEFLKFEIIYMDDELWELAVTASNGAFAGYVEFYVHRDEVRKLAEGLQGFPRKISDRYSYQNEKRGRDDLLKLDFSCSNGTGTVEIRIEMENADLRARTSFSVFSVTAGMDEFVGALDSMAKSFGEVRSVTLGYED